MYAHARWYLYSLGGLDEYRVVFVCSCNQVGTNEVTSPHSELIGSCDCQDGLYAASRDVPK